MVQAGLLRAFGARAEDHALARRGDAGRGVQPEDALQGQSLLPVLHGAQGHGGDVLAEYSSEGVCAPSRMLRRGRHKFVLTRGLPPQPFDLQHDPLELDNLAGRPELAATEQALPARLLADWDPDATDARIRASQRRRLFLRELGLKNGGFPNWSHEARPGDPAMPPALRPPRT